MDVERAVAVIDRNARAQVRLVDDILDVATTCEFEEIAQVIAGRINKVPGVVDTATHIAFRAYSRHDLEAAFSIGFEQAD